MGKSVVVVLICIALSVLITGCLNQNGGSAIVQATPASQKCVNDGGQDRVVYGPNGRTDLCLFSDGSVCEENAYYSGRCAKGGCLRKCGSVGTRSEGWYDCHGALLFYDTCSNESAVTAGTC